jgi:type IV secretory pathway component VirB8
MQFAYKVPVAVVQLQQKTGTCRKNSERCCIIFHQNHSAALDVFNAHRQKDEAILTDACRDANTPKNSVSTAKKIQLVSVTKINCLMPFKETSLFVLKITRNS